MLCCCSSRPVCMNSVKGVKQRHTGLPTSPERRRKTLNGRNENSIIPEGLSPLQTVGLGLVRYHRPKVALVCCLAVKRFALPEATVFTIRIDSTACLVTNAGPGPSNLLHLSWSSTHIGKPCAAPAMLPQAASHCTSMCHTAS
jgi:hypothetical protein